MDIRTVQKQHRAKITRGKRKKKHYKVLFFSFFGGLDFFQRDYNGTKDFQVFTSNDPRHWNLASHPALSGTLHPNKDGGTCEDKVEQLMMVPQSIDRFVLFWVKSYHGSRAGLAYLGLSHSSTPDVVEGPISGPDN